MQKGEFQKLSLPKKRLKAINSEVEIESHIMDVTPKELEQLVSGVDLILDGTDNFDIRMMMNDISQKYQHTVDLWLIVLAVTG